MRRYAADVSWSWWSLSLPQGGIANGEPLGETYVYKNVLSLDAPSNRKFLPTASGASDEASSVSKH
jgi:hypothetical protein